MSLRICCVTIIGLQMGPWSSFRSRRRFEINFRLKVKAHFSGLDETMAVATNGSILVIAVSILKYGDLPNLQRMLPENGVVGVWGVAAQISTNEPSCASPPIPCPILGFLNAIIYSVTVSPVQSCCIS